MNPGTCLNNSECRQLVMWCVKNKKCVKQMQPDSETVVGFKKPKGLPKIVCLCGSTKFWEEFKNQNIQETLKGNIVLSVAINSSNGKYDKVKKDLDELHLRKIDLADEVFFLNVGGYMGESTRSELKYARSLNKVIRFYDEIADEIEGL